MIAVFLFMAAVWIVPVYFVAIRRRGGTLGDLGLRSAALGLSVRAIGSAFAILFAANILWRPLAQRFHLAPQPDMLKRFPPGVNGFVLALILGAVVAPIAEELFFRGFLFAGLRKDHPFWLAAMGSALIFAVGHMVPGAILPLGVLGFLFAWLRERTGSIWPSIVMHAANNALYFTVRFVGQQ